MGIPVSFSELSTTASSNPPAASEGVSQGDDQLRQVYAFIRSLYEGSSGGQLVFPATQNASTNANTLDDYEEGSFTPTDVSGAALSFSVASGRYVKVGKVVNFWLKVTYPATASGTQCAIGGLPFAALNTLDGQSIAIGFTDTSLASSAFVVGTTTSLYVYNAANRATNANLTGSSIYLGGSYEASA